jgi:hypothetical protein
VVTSAVKLVTCASGLNLDSTKEEEEEKAVKYFKCLKL